MDTGPDHNFYFEFARWAGGSKFAFFDFWMEYPPLMPWLAGLAYRFSLLFPPWNYAIFWFNLIFRLCLLPFDVGVLILVYATARLLVSQEHALWLAALWTLLFAPFFTLLAWFDSVAIFFLLLALYGLLTDRPVVAGAALGLGFMVKVFPVVLSPMGLFTLRNNRQRAIYVGSALAAAGVVLLPPLISAPQYVVAMFRAFLSRSSWETVWALLEGYTSYGAVATLDTHLDATASGFQAHPATLPWGLISLAFAAIYLFILTRRIHWGDKNRVTAFALFSLMWFVLYSKGYSPQWAPYIAVMALLSLPLGYGLGYALLMDGFLVAELTLAFQVLQGEPGFVTGVIILRTLVFVLLALDGLAGALPEWRVWRTVRRVAFPGSLAISLIGGMALAKPAWRAYTAMRLEAEPLAAFVQTWRGEGAFSAPIVTLQSDLVERLTPYVGASNVVWFPHIYDTAWEVPATWLEDFSTRHDAAWWVVDENQRTALPSLFAEMTAWLDARACAGEQAQYGPVSVTKYYFTGVSAPRQVRFEDGLSLVSATPLPGALAPGDSACLRLVWTADEELPAEYAVFVHLLSAGGQLVAQADAWPFVPTSTWAVGERYGSAQLLHVSPDLPLGSYTLVAGLYEIEGGGRLNLLAGGDAVELGSILVERRGDH